MGPQNAPGPANFEVQDEHVLAELDLGGLGSDLARMVAAALREDVSPSDATTRLCVPKSKISRAKAASRGPVIVSGLEPFRLAFLLTDRRIKVKLAASDGDRLPKGGLIAELEGPAASILTAERVALNFLGRLSGVATLTAKYVEAAGPNGPAILDTRKTTPLLRSLEKAAVLHGGGRNHRYNLHDGLLIKDNHIRAVGSVTEAIGRVKAAKPHLLKIEVEVDTLEQLKEALTAGADAILLDNMTPVELSEAVKIADDHFRPGPRAALLEASGGVNLETVGDMAKTGVDMISVGAITHSAPCADVGLDWLD